MSARRYYDCIDPGGASGVSCLFAATTGISGSATTYIETTNITGAAGATVNLQITTYSNTNDAGKFFINGVQYFLNNTFSIVLNGSGQGSFTSQITGDAGNIGTIVRAIITIQSVTVGQIGYPNTHQVSKAF